MDGKGAEGLIGAFLEWKDAVLGFAIAAFFGAVKHINELIFGEKKPQRFHWTLTIGVKGAIAGCVGLLTLWLLVELELVKSQAGRAFCIAIAGWGGAETIQFFWDTGRDALRDALNRRSQKDS